MSENASSRPPRVWKPRRFFDDVVEEVFTDVEYTTWEEEEQEQNESEGKLFVSVGISLHK